MISRTRTALVGAGVVLLFAAMASAFWYQDLRYSLPTPRPAGLAEPPQGEMIALPELSAVEQVDAARQPIFLHFFNADCPCSRFNLDHVAELYRHHGGAARFVAVVQASGDDAELAALQSRASKMLHGMTTVVDRDGEIAKACGVYSTPQAVLLSPERRLLYRGNYNVTRYCGDPATQFARLALEAALGSNAVPPMPAAATVAYGCELPVFQSEAALFR